MTVRPIFLVSLPRSGSTLVQRVLAAHRDVVTTPEPWIALPHAYALRERGIHAEYTHPIAARAIRDFVGRLPGGEDDYWEALRGFVLDLYGRAAGDARYFLDKTPRYHHVLPELFRMFPDGKYVFLWRDPLAVVASIVETWSKGRWNVERWHGDLFAGVANLVAAYEQHADASLAVRYEDFVRAPEASWPQLFDYLELPYDPSVLTRFSTVALQAPMGDPTGTHRYTSISEEPLEKWSRTLARPIRKRWCRAYLRWIGAERLDVMGYDLEDLEGALEALPSSPRGLVSDLLHGSFWSFARRRKELVYGWLAPRVR